MKYYKVVDNSGAAPQVLDVFEAETFDVYLEVLGQLDKDKEDIEEIKEEEFNYLDKVFKEMDEEIPFDNKTIYSDINIKLTLLDFFKQTGQALTLEEMDKYFKWLVGNR